MIDTKTEQRIIYKRAEGKGIDKIKKELSLNSYNPIRRVIKEKANIIEAKGRELANKNDTINERILFYAKNEQLKRLSKTPNSISDTSLNGIIKEHDRIQRLDTNKPTSITDSKKLTNATTPELLNEYQTRLDNIRRHSQGTE